MRTLRIFFAKTGRAKYISHLDLTRCFTRAFARTDIPVWYTEGFNPRIYMTFSLPLSLGYTGEDESMDFRLVEDGYPDERAAEQLRAVMPEGLDILRAAPPESDPMEIVWADYRIGLVCDDPQALCDRLREFFARPSVTVVKKTKKSQKELDIAPLMKLLSLEAQEDRAVLCLRLAAGNTLNVSPSLPLDAFYEAYGMAPGFKTVCRTAILKGDFSPFR